MKRISALFLVIMFAAFISGCDEVMNLLKQNQKNIVYAVYKAMDPGVQDFDKKMDATVAVVASRLREQGLPSARVLRQGSDQIRIELPRLDSPDAVFKLVGAQGILEFVDPDGKVVLTGDRIIRAQVGMQNGGWVIDFVLNEQGTVEFAEATERLVGQPIKILLDGKEISSPVVNTAITGGSGYIEGDFTQASAEQMAVQLRSGAFPLKLEMVESGMIEK